MMMALAPQPAYGSIAERLFSTSTRGTDSSMQKTNGSGTSTLPRGPQKCFAQPEAASYLSEIQDLVYKTYVLPGGPINYSLNGGSTASRKSRQRSTCTRFSAEEKVQNVVLDQATFTENLIKRLSLTRRLSATSPNTLPPAIDTYFEVNTIMIKKSAALLPAMTDNLTEELHSLLTLNVRHLELHIKLSFRPVFHLQQRHRFEVKPDHISHIESCLPRLISQLPRLRTLTLVLDSLFDLPPRPRDYQRFLRTQHYHASASREDNISDSNLAERLTDAVVPLLRKLGLEAPLARVALKHHPGAEKEGPEVVNGVSIVDSAVARAVLDQHGREVVLKGWL